MIYSQRNPQWAAQRLGTCNGVTIGSEGCYVTAMAMTATHFGHNINPAQLDDLFTNQHLYMNGCDCFPGILSKVFPDIEYIGVGNWANTSADLNWLKQGNDFYTDVEIEVDFDHNPNDGIQTHFVRMVSYGGGTNGTDLIIDDPWYGTQDPFSLHYGSNPAQTILQAVAYRIPAPAPAPVPAPQVAPVSAATPTPEPQPPVAEPAAPVTPAEPVPVEIPITIKPVPEPVAVTDTPAIATVAQPVIMDRIIHAMLNLLIAIFTFGKKKGTF